MFTDYTDRCECGLPFVRHEPSLDRTEVRSAGLGPVVAIGPPKKPGKVYCSRGHATAFREAQRRSGGPWIEVRSLGLTTD